MKFTLEINCDGDAFQDGNLRKEVARQLRAAQYYIEEWHFNKGSNIDQNGNLVGTWAFSEGDSSSTKKE